MMYLGFMVHFKLLILILKLFTLKLTSDVSKYLWKLSITLLHFLSGKKIIDIGLKVGQRLTNSKVSRKQAIVILTKISTKDYPPPELTLKIGKQNAFFIERIMTEKLAHTLTELKHEFADNGKELSLYICYQDRFFFRHPISSWLERLPDYNKRLDPVKSIRSTIDERFEVLKESFENKLSQIDLSFDADSFCSVKSRKPATSTFKYVPVEDTDDGRALEAAIRVGFYHDNQDIIVLNPHAVELTKQHVIDALSYLENNVDIKDRLIYGKTQLGGLYLVGVSRSRDTLLDIRRLTQDVIWGSTNAFDVIAEHQNNLNWSDACLKPILDEVRGMDSLPLLERELGLKMEHIPSNMISVVIPTCNHEEYIQETLQSLVYHVSGMRSIQIIAVDANSNDYTMKKLKQFRDNLDTYLGESAHIFPHRGHNVQLKNCLKSREKQKIPTIDLKSLIRFDIFSLPPEFCETRESQVRYAVENLVEGGTLLVLRPGTNVPLYWDISIRKCLNQLGVIMGVFSFHLFLQDRYIARKNIGWALRSCFMNFVFNFRSRYYEMPSGDQGYFMYTYYYRMVMLNNEEENSSTNWLPPVLDDVAILKKVKAAGHITTVPACVTVCPIKALRFGFCRSWLFDSLLITAYKLGADPRKLSQYSDELIVVKPDYFDGY